MRLARALPWRVLIELVVKDLKNTTNRECWWMGRKIKVRVHLGGMTQISGQSSPPYVLLPNSSSGGCSIVLN
jgi:hypothetical protein